MPYKLYDSVAEMLAPQTLSERLQIPVNYVRCRPFASSDSNSSSRFMRVEIGQESHARYVLKRTDMATDWTMRASDDTLCRSVTVWQHGLLDQLQPDIEHAIVACSRDEGGWAILMHDLSAGLFRPDQPLSAKTVRRLLDGLAAMHATFWQSSVLTDPQLGLCDTAALLQMLSPTTVSKVSGITTKHPQMLTEGLELLPDVLAADVVEVIRPLLADPQPLCRALSRYPSTLVHGNPRKMNMALLPTEPAQFVLFDWQTAGYAAATIDLVWFLDMAFSSKVSLSRADLINIYQQSLICRLGDRFNPAEWQAMFELGSLANVLRLCCIKAWFSQHSRSEFSRKADLAALESFNGVVRTAIKWL